MIVRFRSLSSQLAVQLAASALLLAALALPAAAVERPDAWVTTKVKIALLTSDQVPGLDVNVDTNDGRVTLQGTVPSAEAKARAEQITRGIEGVRDVRNLIQTGGSSGTAQATQAGAPSDETLRSNVETVLERDQALEGSDVRVQSVNDGVVVLAGRAETLSDHRRALEDAASVQGVKKVASEIESPDELSDAEIWREGKMDAENGRSASAWDMWLTTKAKVALMANDETPGLGINVDTRDGVVTLFGVVDSDQAKQAAGEQVAKIGGVTRVENELQVVPESKQEQVERSDEQIRGDIQDRLARHESLKGDSIDVAVADGVARLQGTVPRQSSRLTALTVAGGTQGVRSVVDDLRVEGTPAVSAGPEGGASTD